MGTRFSARLLQQRSRSLVLTKRIAASGDDNGKEEERKHDWGKAFVFILVHDLYYNICAQSIV